MLKLLLLTSVNLLAVDNISSFTASAQNWYLINLAWVTNNVTGQWDGMVVRMRTTGFPTGPTDGTLVDLNTGANLTKAYNTSFANTTHNFTAYSYISSGGLTLYSTGVTASTKTSPRPNTFPIIDTFEDVNIDAFPDWNASDGSRISDIAFVTANQGNYSFHITGNATNYYVGYVSGYVGNTPDDWSQYPYLRLFIYNNGNIGDKLRFEIYDNDNSNWSVDTGAGATGDDRWTKDYTMNWTGSWKEISIPLTANAWTEANSSTGNNTFDLAPPASGFPAVTMLAFSMLSVTQNGSMDINMDTIQLTLNAVPVNAPSLLQVIYPSDGLVGVPERPTTYNVSFLVSDNISYEPVVVDIYFGRDGTALTLLTQNMLATALTVNFNVGTINRQITYNWQVVAKNSNDYSAALTGPIWTFRTQNPGDVELLEDARLDLDPEWYFYDGVSINTTNVSFDGGAGLQITGNAASWYIGGAGITYWQDVSTYSYVAMAIRKIAGPDNRYNLNLTEGDRDVWSYINPVENTGWIEINMPINVFAKVSGSGDGIWKPAGGLGTVPEFKLNLQYDENTGFNSQTGVIVDRIRFMQTGSLSDSQPQIIARGPSGNNVFAPLTSAIHLTFSEAMDKTSVETGLTIYPETQVSMTWFGNTLIITPLYPLEPNTVYTVEVDKAIAKDLNGQALTGTTTMQFNTSGGGSGYGPEVLGWFPRGTGVPLNPTIMAIFSENISANTVTIGNYTVRDSNGNNVLGSISVINNMVIFTPNVPLLANTIYTVSLNSNIKDVDGDSLGSDFTWNFQTGNGLGASPPTVLGHSILGKMTEARPTATTLFSETMNQANVQAGYNITTSPAGTFTWTNGSLLSFKPNVDLLTGYYTITINAGVLDAETPADGMVNNDVWTFGRDLIAPNPVTVIIPSQNGRELVLTVVAPTDNMTPTRGIRFNVYRSSTANFSTSVNIIRLTPSLNFTATSDWTTTLNFFVIKAVDGVGNESVTSQVAFRKDHYFTGVIATDNIFWVSLPFIPGYQTAQDMAQFVNNAAVPGSATKLRRYANNQITTELSYTLGAWTNNYNLAAGEAYGIIIPGTATADFSLVGVHDPNFSFNLPYNALAANINWISIPFNAPYQTANDVAQAINNAGPGIITSIESYSTDQVTRLTWSYFALADVWAGNNFPIEPGKGYSIVVSGNITWKPSVIMPR